MKKFIVPFCGTFFLGGCLAIQDSSLKASFLTKEERIQKEKIYKLKTSNMSL